MWFFRSIYSLWFLVLLIIWALVSFHYINEKFCLRLKKKLYDFYPNVLFELEFLHHAGQIFWTYCSCEGNFCSSVPFMLFKHDIRYCLRNLLTSQGKILTNMLACNKNFNIVISSVGCLASFEVATFYSFSLCL